MKNWVGFKFNVGQRVSVEWDVGGNVSRHEGVVKRRSTCRTSGDNVYLVLIDSVEYSNRNLALASECRLRRVA
jgi:hypothetical protein